MKPEEIITEIKELLNSKNNQFDGNFYCFRYSGNIKTLNETYKLNTNPSISIFGKDVIKKYRSLFNDLKKCLCKEKKISLKTFMNATQNLLFEDKFNVKKINEVISSVKELTVTNFRKVYGLTMRKNDIKLGPFFVVKKGGLEKYIEKREFSFDDSLSKDYFIGMIRSDSKSDEDFVYVLYEHNSFDSFVSRMDFAQKIEEFEKIVRFMIAVKNERVFISHKPFATYVDNVFQIIDGRRFSSDSHVCRKDIPFYIDDPYFTNKELGYDKIWDIISSSDKNDMQSRIVTAIKWLGESFVEEESNKTVAEIAFAFETLLYGNSEAFISKGVVSSLAEAYAFIVGTNPEERIELEKEFKCFYKKRSTISHGARIEPANEEDIRLFYKMIYKTICRILTIKEFSNCKSAEELYNVIQLMRYK